MDKNKEFKFIKGAYAAGLPADICFYTDVDYWSVQDFLWEFDYLENYVNPSVIRIHINSVGGEVVEGMSVFAKIQNCQIPTQCINDSLAASMGSIIWAAGDELFMKDYALLMIHNPFCEVKGDKQYNQATEAFTQQLKTIYMKRFGLDEKVVEEIMNGKEGEDGTFLTAEQAVTRGIITQNQIIETPKAVKDKVQAALKNVTDVAQIKAVYGLLSDSATASTINQQNNKPKNIKMDDKNISVLAAILGLTGEKATVDNVTAKINEIKSVAAEHEATKKSLDEVKAELTKTKAELTGAQTSVKNLTEDLEKANASLKVYQDAEAKAKEDKVNALIDKAIAECKINKEERDAYVKMAQNDYDLATNVLAKIPARAQLSREISEGNAGEASENVLTTEQQIKAKVEAIVGKDFKFRSL